jgi:hypothetical protein
MNAGIATVARIPMMATTIISSMRVNPRWTLFMLCIATPAGGFQCSKLRATDRDRAGRTTPLKCSLPQ